MAAGIVLVREAGGFVTDITGDNKIFETRDIIAGNDYIHRELVKILRPLGK